MMIAKQKQICDSKFDIGASTTHNFLYLILKIDNNFGLFVQLII